MNHFIEKNKNIPQPNYDLMWNNIEQEAYQRLTKEPSPQKSARRYLKAIPMGAVLSCLLLISVPVFAGVAMNWDKIGGTSVTNALENGIGQQYELQDDDSGVVMHLHGVVTDGEKMKMLLSMDTNSNEDLTSYIGFATETNVLVSESGSKAKVTGYVEYDPDSKKLIGIYETPDTLQEGNKDYRLEAQNLIFYRNQDIPVKPKDYAGDTIYTGITRYPAIHMESITHTREHTTLRYKISSTQSQDTSGVPQLAVNINGQQHEAVPTQLPTNNTDLYVEQVFDVTEQEWQQASLHLTYVEEAKRIEGTWEFAFHADGKKASEAIYTKELQTNPEFVAKTGISLKQLVVTPLMINVLTNQGELGSLKDGDVHYNTAKLLIGDKLVTGGWNLKSTQEKGKYQQLFDFESPEWFTSWANVPMKLILQNAVVSKRDTSKNWVTLNQPTAEKQSTSLTVDGFKIHFTYYTVEGKLVIESSSNSAGFKGVNQTTLRINGKEIIPEISPKGMVSTGVNIDRYSNIPLTEKIELNPGLYRYSDPTRDVEINL